MSAQCISSRRTGLNSCEGAERSGVTTGSRKGRRELCPGPVSAIATGARAGRPSLPLRGLASCRGGARGLGPAGRGGGPGAAARGPQTVRGKSGPGPTAMPAMPRPAQPGRSLRLQRRRWRVAERPAMPRGRVSKPSGLWSKMP